jgi:hypothetical protein
MKRSETPADIRAGREEYIATRWGQLSELSTSWGDEAIKYLLFVNAAAMAGTLSFIGAMVHLRPAAWPKIALLLFVVGVVLIGFYHAFRYQRTEWLFGRWREDVDQYKADAMEWNDLLDRDKPRWDQCTWPLMVLPYASFGCFLAGLLIAILNFHEITNAPPRESSHGTGTGSPITTP